MGEGKIVFIHVILKMLATVLFVIVLAGPHVLRKAHKMLSPMIKITGLDGKKNTKSVPMNKFCYKTIV